jgi:tetratricopeptide (TPR) repeat protein
LRLAGALHYFWLVRGQAVEARGWLERALAVPRAGAPTAARAKATLSSWIFAEAMGDHVAARRAAEEAVALYRQLGDARGVAWSLRELGHEALRRQELDRAKPLLDEAYALATRVGDRWIVAQVRETQAFLAEGRGELARGRRLFEESLALFRALGDWRAIGTSLWCLAATADDVGDETTARRWAEEAVAIFRDLRATTRLSGVLTILGRIELGAANHALSRRYLDESLALGRQAGDQDLIAGALLGLGSLDQALGDAAGARARFEEALAVAVQSRRRALVAELIRWHGVQAIGSGMPGRGTRLLGAADATGLPPSLYGLVKRTRRTEGSLRQARELLGTEAFQAAWAAGQAMTLDEAVAEALAEEGRA